MTNATFDPSAVAVGTLAPDGAFGYDGPFAVPIDLECVKVPFPQTPPLTPADFAVIGRYATFRREVASTDEGKHSYTWRRES